MLCWENCETNVKQDDKSKRGLVLDLNEGNYMTWAAKDSPGADTYALRMTYCQDGSIFPKGVSLSANMYMNNWDIYDTTIQTSSDERLKKEIRNRNVDALSIINALPCKEFKWKADDRFEEVGFIAQQVKEVNPKFVGEKFIDGETYYTLDLIAIIPYLVKAIQELTAKIGNYPLTVAMSSAKVFNEYQRPKPIELKFEAVSVTKCFSFCETIYAGEKYYRLDGFNFCENCMDRHFKVIAESLDWEAEKADLEHDDVEVR